MDIKINHFVILKPSEIFLFFQLLIRKQHQIIFPLEKCINLKKINQSNKKKYLTNMQLKFSLLSINHNNTVISIFDSISHTEKKMEFTFNQSFLNLIQHEKIDPITIWLQSICSGKYCILFAKTLLQKLTGRYAMSVDDLKQIFIQDKTYTPTQIVRYLKEVTIELTEIKFLTFFDYDTTIRKKHTKGAPILLVKFNYRFSTLTKQLLTLHELPACPLCGATTIEAVSKAGKKYRTCTHSKYCHDNDIESCTYFEYVD